MSYRVPRIKVGRAVDWLTGEVTFYVYDSEGYVYRGGFKTRSAAMLYATEVRR